jgi:hypothetical protein
MHLRRKQPTNHQSKHLHRELMAAQNSRSFGVLGIPRELCDHINGHTAKESYWSQAALETGEADGDMLAAPMTSAS